MARVDLHKELKAAWAEVLKFGEHEGDCNFDGVCGTCETSTGRCDHHRDAMEARITRMNKAIEAIIDN
jgi:hypothetical protein